MRGVRPEMSRPPVVASEKGRPTQILLRDICSMVHCTTVEPPLNYEQVMLRYSFSTPPKRAMTVQEWLKLCEQYVKLWIELLIAEKRRQMHATHDRWPKLLPWSVDGLRYASCSVAVEAQGSKARRKQD